jgi:hypothetical protein
MKFKNIKKKAKKLKSPSNSRKIPEKFTFPLPKVNHAVLLRIYKDSLAVFVVLIYIVAFIVVGLDFKYYLPVKQNVESERKVLAEDLKFWENFISKHKDFRDAYFRASVLEYQLGDNAKAKMYVENGLALDPNSENGRKIESLLK